MCVRASVSAAKRKGEALGWCMCQCVRACACTCACACAFDAHARLTLCSKKRTPGYAFASACAPQGCADGRSGSWAALRPPAASAFACGSRSWASPGGLRPRGQRPGMRWEATSCTPARCACVERDGLRAQCRRTRSPGALLPAPAVDAAAAPTAVGRPSPGGRPGIAGTPRGCTPARCARPPGMAARSGPLPGAAGPWPL